VLEFSRFSNQQIIEKHVSLQFSISLRLKDRKEGLIVFVVTSMDLDDFNDVEENLDVFNAHNVENFPPLPPLYETPNPRIVRHLNFAGADEHGGTQKSCALWFFFFVVIFSCSNKTIWLFFGS
jgi:hypothetical protein